MTQGLVSIVDQRGRVLFKLITGADGYLAREVAIEARKVLEDGGGAVELRRMAIALGFGEEESEGFIVQDRTRDLGDGGRDVTAELTPSYREHFDDPRWNPRWAQGTAAHTEVVVWKGAR